jgi:hypothetical protein
MRRIGKGNPWWGVCYGLGNTRVTIVSMLIYIGNIIFVNQLVRGVTPAGLQEKRQVAVTEVLQRSRIIARY